MRLSNERLGAFTNAIFVLSLDVTQPFVNELGTNGLPTDVVQRIARDSISEVIPSLPEWDFDMDKLCNEFFIRAGNALGCETLRVFERWFSCAFPKHADLSRYWLWYTLLQNLKRLWDSEDADPELPLGGKTLVEVRVIIRDYLTHLDNVDSEIGMATGRLDSDWDLKIDDECSEWLPMESYISEIVRNLHSIELWQRLKSSLGAQQLEELQCWGKAEGRREHMPMRYIGLPIRANIR